MPTESYCSPFCVVVVLRSLDHMLFHISLSAISTLMSMYVCLIHRQTLPISVLLSSLAVSIVLKCVQDKYSRLRNDLEVNSNVTER